MAIDDILIEEDEGQLSPVDEGGAVIEQDENGDTVVNYDVDPNGMGGEGGGEGDTPFDRNLALEIVEQRAFQDRVRFGDGDQRGRGKPEEMGAAPEPRHPVAGGDGRQFSRALCRRLSGGSPSYRRSRCPISGTRDCRSVAGRGASQGPPTWETQTTKSLSVPTA